MAKSDTLTQLAKDDEGAMQRPDRGTISPIEKTTPRAAPRTKCAEDSQELWEQRLRRPLTQEEVRQATENVSGVFYLLAAWDAS